MLTTETLKTVTLAQLGDLRAGAARNARNIANQLQGAFRFDWRSERLQLDKDSYSFPNGGFDLAKAAVELLRENTLPRPLILFTSLPFSAPEYATDNEGLLFSGPVFEDEEVAIVSTHLWEQLPGQRALQPYLLFMLAGLTLQFCSKLAYHEEVAGCFFDTCEEATDIDEAFKACKLCESCEHQMEKRVRAGSLRVEQVAAAKKLFNRAFGKKVCFMAMPFDEHLQPVYEMIADTLAQKKWIVVRADEISRPRRIIDRIQQSILASDLVLADLSGNNPNVFYELGMAHAVGGDVILLTQEDKLPFDISTEQTIFYESTEPGLKELSRKLIKLAGKGTW